MRSVPLGRLLDKHQAEALLAAFANASTHPVTLGLADATGKWLAAYPAPPRDDLVQQACESGQAAFNTQAVATPLVIEGKVYGILYSNRTAQAISKGIQRALEMLIQGALSQKSLARETLDRYREINLLYRVHETIGSLLELREVIQRVLQESTRIIKADGGSVLLADELTDRLVAQDDVGINVADAERSLINQALSAKVSNTGKSRILNDMDKYVRPQAAQDVQLVSLLAAPLKSGQDVLGVITLGRTRKEAMFTAGDQKLLAALASQAGIAIANAREVEARERRLKQQIKALRIKIDETKKQREVNAVTEKEWFAHLQENARQMRAEFDI